MKARDLMTKTVFTVTSDTAIADIAKTLAEHAVSAVPVIDGTGMPIGMVSEGDLIGRSEADRAARRDWWLSLFTDAPKPQAPPPSAGGHRVAHDIMSAPLVTVTEDTDAAEIARLLSTYRIKRVPVVKDGRMVGVVSRSDLLKAIAAAPAAEKGSHRPNRLAEMLEGLERHFQNGRNDPSPREAMAPSAPPRPAGVKVGDFRTLVADHDTREARQRDEARRVAVQRRSENIKGMIDRHIGNEAWQSLLHRAREAAEHGQKEFMLLRFPSELCSDGGRAINVPLPEWPDTLRGEAAELYLRWERDLKPSGFKLSARILDFPGGKPGDAGLFLGWNE